MWLRVSRQPSASVVACERPTTDGWSTDLSFFFELFFLGRTQARGRPECFAIVEHRQIPHVKGQRTDRRLLVDDHDDGTALDAFAERDAAATGQPRVGESLQHRAIIPRERARAEPRSTLQKR